jgi:putative copper export protein
VLDLCRLWHQTYAFYGGFEPLTPALAWTIADSTLWGGGWKLQSISGALAAAVFAACAREGRGGWVMAIPTVALVAIARPLTGHALEQGSWLSLPAILQAVHVLAAATWLGALSLMIGVVLRRANALPGADRTRIVAALVQSFSPLALGSATALFVAGCATSFMYLGGLSAAFSTVYGNVLVAKVVAFGGVLAIGYYNWQRVGPRLEAAMEAAGHDPEAQRLLARAAGAEVAVAALVLVLTSILVNLPMPGG